MFGKSSRGTCNASQALEGGPHVALAPRPTGGPGPFGAGFRPAPAVVGRHRGADRIRGRLLHAPVNRAISTARAVADAVTALDSRTARRMSSGSGTRPAPRSGRVSVIPP